MLMMFVCLRFMFRMILFLWWFYFYIRWFYIFDDRIFLVILCSGWFVLLCTMCIIVHLILCKNLPQVQHHSVQLLGSYEAKRTKIFFSGFQIVTKWQMTAWMNAQTNEQTKEWLIKWMKNIRWNAVMNVYNVQKIIWISASKTEPVTAGVDATVNVWFLGQIYVNKKPHIYRCIRSNRGRLGLHNTRVIRVKRRFRLFLGQC